MANNTQLVVISAVLIGLAYMNKRAIAGAYAKFTQRGIRNNNAGNLVLTSIPWQGKVPNDKNTDGHFEQFIAPEWGIRAMYKDVKNDIGKGLNTVRKLIASYAPPSENDTQKYISVVASALNKSPDALITANDYPDLIKAIIKHENGVQPYPDTLIAKGIALA